LALAVVRDAAANSTCGLLAIRSTIPGCPAAARRCRNKRHLLLLLLCPADAATLLDIQGLDSCCWQPS
jgi:hypothetical protein